MTNKKDAMRTTSPPDPNCQAPTGEEAAMASPAGEERAGKAAEVARGAAKVAGEGVTPLDELETRCAILENENKILKERLENAKESESLKAELEEQKQSYLRLYADFENFRKRARSEQASSIDYGKSEVMEKLLPVLDNFARALENPAGGEEFFHGVELIRKGLLDALGAQGLTEIEAEGVPFDPNVHNAVMTDNDPDKDDNTVTACLQTGYKFKDKVIRPSMVKVNQK